MTNSTSFPPATDLGVADPRRLLDRGFDIATTTLEGVTADQLELPTPCDDMDVRRLQQHLVMVGKRVACAGRGEDPQTWPVESTDLADDEVLDAWRTAMTGARQAWSDDALLTRETRVPWAVLSGSEAVAIYLAELLTHTWDLAQATGQSPAWDDDAVALATVAMHSQLPLADRTPIWEAAKASLPADVEWEAPFGPAVEVPDDAPAIDRLVAWTGRRP
jgi:uncharacterized protein (TIGR03086 family)